MKYTHWSLFVLTGGLLVACGGGGGGGDGGGNGGGLSVPADALTITAGNAEATGNTAAEVAVSVPTSLTDISVTGVVPVTQSVPLLSASDLAQALRQQLSSSSASAALTIASGVAVNESCTFGGTISGDVDETETRTNGTINFNGCKLFSSVGAGLNGSLTIDFQDLSSTQYSASITGSFSYAVPEFGTVSYQGLDFFVSGDDATGEYSARADVAISGLPGGGFLLQTIQNFTGNDNSSPDCPSAGQFIVTGAGGTQLRATSNGTQVTVEFNDGSRTFVPVAGSPVFCTRIFG